MIYALALVLSLLQGNAVAQDTSSNTTSIPLVDQITLSNLGKDTRDLLKGRYTQTGMPLFKNGFYVGSRSNCTTSSGGSSSGIVMISSRSVDIDQLGWTNLVIGPSISGATLTLNAVGGGFIHIWIRATWTLSQSNRVYVGALQDGVVTPLQTPSTGLSVYYPDVASAGQPVGLAVDTWFPSTAGSHNYTITGFVGSGTGTWIGCKNESSCYWGVEEWKAQ